MKHVFSFLKPYKLSIFVAYSMMLIELMIELLLPLFLGLMIDQGVIAQDLDKIMMWGSIMIGLALFYLIIGIINSFYSTHVSVAFGYDIRQELFLKLQYFTFKQLNHFPTSGIITRFTNDIRQIQNTVFMGLRIMAKAPLIVIGGVTMAFIVNFRLAAIFLITVPLLVGLLLIIMRYSSRMFKRVQEKVDKVNLVMQENLAGMRLIKAFTRPKYEQTRFDDANLGLADQTKTAFRFIESAMPVLMFLMNLSLVFIIWYGHSQSLLGNVQAGEVVTVINYALRISMAITMFAFIIMLLSRTKASAERVEEIFVLDDDGISEALDKDKGVKVTAGTVTYDAVSFHYPDQKKNTLEHISFTIQPKETLAIIGATGSGKTTLFQLLPRLYEPTSGEVRIDGIKTSDYSYKALRQSIGYVPQNPLLFTGTIRDNIAWGKKDATDEEIIQAAKDAQIHERILDFPDGYDSVVGQKGVNLSGGQKQRISIARALIRKPKILMLDDSTSALDLTTEAYLLQALEKYEATTLIITQKISTAMKQDKIMLLDEGEILAHGRHEDLLKQSDLYRQIVASQFGKEYANASK